jgi:hypothetical protein
MLLAGSRIRRLARAMRRPYQDKEPYWLDVKAGESVVVPGNAPHAVRNASTSSVRMLMILDARVGRFFDEIGRPVTAGDQPPMPSEEWVHAFAAAAVRYVYWLASPGKMQLSASSYSCSPAGPDSAASGESGLRIVTLARTYNEAGLGNLYFDLVVFVVLTGSRIE